MQVVIVPAWQRPEFLWACLRRLLIADRPWLTYLIALDRAHTRDVFKVAREFQAALGRKRVDIRARQHSWRGNSYNVLESYRDALARRPELVHLVEEDIFVGADHFDFHNRAWELAPAAFAVSACRNQAFPVGQEPPPAEAVAYTHNSYQSLGVSLPPHVLEHVLRHATNAYYRDPAGYCARTFPASAIPPGHCEQDGLINRVREAASGATTYPATPRAYHAGYYGYNRRGAFGVGAREPIPARGAFLLGLGGDQLNERARHYRDFTTVNLDTPREPVARVLPWPE